jgi:hypothetical protein
MPRSWLLGMDSRQAWSSFNTPSSDLPVSEQMFASFQSVAYYSDHLKAQEELCHTSDASELIVVNNEINGPRKRAQLNSH